MQRIYKEFHSLLIDVFRNGLLSLLSVITMSMALLTISIVVLLNIVGGHLQSSVYSQLTLSVELHDHATEPQIKQLINTLRTSPYVAPAGVQYISKEKAFDDLKDRYQDHSSLRDLVSDIDNPLYSSLIISTVHPTHHPYVIDLVMGDSFEGVVREIKEGRARQATIERIGQALGIINQVGLVSGFVFLSIALLSVYNTTRLGIYSRRHEIEIMKLVGARYNTIRKPFALAGVFYGICGCILSFLILLPLVSIATRGVFDFLDAGMKPLLQFASTTAPFLFFISLTSGISLGLISSVLATYSYIDRPSS